MQTHLSLLAKPLRTSMNVTLAYESMSSALWAAETLTDLLRKDRGAPALNLSPWCFGVLGNPAWCSLAAADTGKADIIVLSTSSKVMQQLPAPIEHWLAMCLRRQPRAGRLAVVAFFRSGKTHDGFDSPRLRKVQHLVQQAGAEFFAPALTEAMPCAV